MKSKKILIIGIFILFLFTTMVYADENNTKMNTDVKINLNAAAISGVYISPDLMFTYSLLRNLSIGGDFKYFYNFRFHDSYLNGYGIVRFKRLYLGAGASFRITDGNDEKDKYYMIIPENKLQMAFTGGLIFRPFKLGPGYLGFNGGLDIFISSTPLEKTSSDDTNIVGNVLSSAIGGALNAILNTIKLNAGVNYTMSF